jgi:hypothetical protein
MIAVGYFYVLVDGREIKTINDGHIVRNESTNTSGENNDMGCELQPLILLLPTEYGLDTTG